MVCVYGVCVSDTLSFKYAVLDIYMSWANGFLSSRTLTTAVIGYSSSSGYTTL